MTRPGHLTLNELTLPASSEWVSQSSAWCFLRVAHGVGYAIRRVAPKSLGEGDVVVFCDAKKILFRASQLTDWKLQFFLVCPELLSGFFTLSEQHYLETAASQADKTVRFYAAADSVAEEFREICLKSEAENYLLLRCRMLRLMVSVLAPELLQHRTEAHRGANAGARFEQLIEALPAAEIQNRTLSELAGLCRCSERHLSRLFRNYFGFSIRARQTEMRLQKAQQLLLESSTKISHIAMESGFRYLGLFNAMFKRRFSMTPSEWRQRHAKADRSKRLVRLAGWCALLSGCSGAFLA